MSKWSLTHYKGYQIGQWEGSEYHFILKNSDINNPVKTGLKSWQECREFIDMLT